MANDTVTVEVKEKAKERLLVCDALDERDFLHKKIATAISNTTFVGCKRKKDDKVGGVVVTEDFKKKASSEFQSIKDMIDRYNRIDTAITLANATTEITTRSGESMTRAAAISLRKSLHGRNGDETLIGLLIDKLDNDFKIATVGVTRLNNQADKELEQYKNNITSKDGKTLSSETISTLESLVKESYGELIDPIGVDNALKELSNQHNTLIKELDSAIKISNATTYVEF